jgi:hypothetical protein
MKRQGWCGVALLFLRSSARNGEVTPEMMALVAVLRNSYRCSALPRARKPYGPFELHWLPVARTWAHQIANHTSVDLETIVNVNLSSRESMGRRPAHDRE